MDISKGTWRSLEPIQGPSAVTLGTFDGVHAGHRAIFDEAIAHARSWNWPAAVAVTFANHPRSVLEGQRSPRILTTPEEKIRLLSATGLDRLVVLEFDEELASMEYDVFVRELLRAKLGMAHFVLGHDVHFGRGRGGNVNTVGDLAEAEGFSFSQVASVRHAGEPISSSRIRDRVAVGDLESAVAMLGHPVPVVGRVVAGRGDGRQLGFPTANLVPAREGKLLPPRGVYGGWATAQGMDRWHKAAVNLGTAPTLNRNGEVRIEVHLIGVEAELDGCQLHAGLEFRMRDEIKFDGIQALVRQIRADVAQVEARLGDPPPLLTWWPRVEGPKG